MPQTHFSADALLRALACDSPHCPCHRAVARGFGNTHCPHHDPSKTDKTPPLTVHEEGGTVLWHCQQCGREQQRVITEAIFKFFPLPERSAPDVNGAVPEVITYRYPNLVTGEVTNKYRTNATEGRPKRVWSDPGFKPEEMDLFNGDLLDDERLADREVFVVEGEEKAKVLNSFNILAVTFAGSSSQSNFGPAVSRLKGRVVNVWPDNDEPGIKSALSRVEAIRSAGPKGLRLLKPVSSELGADVADLLAGYGIEQWREVHALVQEWVDDGLDVLSGPVSDPMLIPFVGMAEALSMPETPISWIADGMLNSGGFSILVGPYKGGKSTLLRVLCACVATGHDFLGRRITQGRVGYSGLEERFDDIMRHFRTLFDGADEEMQNLAMVSAGDDWVPGKLEERFDVIETSIERHQLSLLVIGPVHDLIQFGNTNDYAEVKSKLRGLKKVAERTGCHIISDHHMNKYGIGRNALLGSVAFGAVADQVFYLPFDKEHGVRAFFSDQRVGVSIDEPLGIEYGREGIASDLGPPPERVKHAMEEQALMEQVVGCCAEARKTLDQIIEQLKERRAKVLAAVQRGVREGYLDVEGRGVRNDPYTYLAISVIPRHDNVIRFPEPKGTE